MKKMFSLLFAVFLFVSFSAFAFAYENEVQDYANLFSEDEIFQIESAASFYTASTEISLAILTTDDTQGLTSEQYANDYIDNLIDYESWNESSMLFLIDMDNRNVWVSTTGRAEDIYYDVDSIIDGGYDYLVNGEYAQCILGMIEAAEDETYFFGDESEIFEEDYVYFPEDTYDYEYETDNSADISDILIYIIVGIGIGGISVLVVKSRYKNFGKGDEFDTDDVFLELTGSDDTVISRNVITTKIPRNNNHHRGGAGGSRPSGGGARSHGGGGRSF